MYLRIFGGWGWRTKTEPRVSERERDDVKLFLDSFSPTVLLPSMPPFGRTADVLNQEPSQALSPPLSLLSERSSLVRDERKRTEAVLLRCGHMQTTVLWPAVLKGSVNRE